MNHLAASIAHAYVLQINIGISLLTPLHVLNSQTLYTKIVLPAIENAHDKFFHTRHGDLSGVLEGEIQLQLRGVYVLVLVSLAVG
jgi:hypothetical protein